MESSAEPFCPKKTNFSFILVIAIGVFIVAIATSPRIPLPIYIPGRRFDLRVEDILLVCFLIYWAFSRRLRQQIYLTPLLKPISVYLLIATVTSIIAVSHDFGSPIRTFFYFLKETEYFIIFFLVANWIKTRTNVINVTYFIIGAGIINALWVGIQFFTSQKGPLFLFRAPSGVYHPPYLLQSYGPGLLGEVSPLSTGVFLCWYFYYLFLTFSSQIQVIKRYMLPSALFFSSVF